MKKNPYSSLLLLSCITCFILQGFSEGTKQVTPYGFQQCSLYLQETATSPNPGCDYFACYDADSNHCICVEIKNTNEKLYMGFGIFFGYPFGFVKCRIKHDGIVVWGEVDLVCTPGEPGFINSYYQAVAGPIVIDPSGYPPFEFTPNEPGTYIVEFDVANIYSHLLYFDFTVVDTTILPLQAINGRVWSRNWSFLHNTGINEGFHGTLYILTNDGMVDSVSYHHRNSRS